MFAPSSLGGSPAVNPSKVPALLDRLGKEQLHVKVVQQGHSPLQLPLTGTPRAL